MNRDLKQRVRPVSGLVNHKQAIKTYIKLAAKIIQNVDNRWGVWRQEGDEKKDDEKEQVCYQNCYVVQLMSLKLTVECCRQRSVEMDSLTLLENRDIDFNLVYLKLSLTHLLLVHRQFWFEM